jgi:CRISPR-associated protein Cas2
MSKRHLWLVAYDIREPERLRNVLLQVKAWSTGGQRSVHECWLATSELAALCGQMRGCIEPRHDSMLLVPADRARGVRTLGIAIKPRDEHFVYIG